MSNINDYWAERARNAINIENLADAKASAEIQRIAAMMTAEIMKEMLAYYTKLATTEGIDLKQAKQIADKFDVEAFKAKAKQLVENKDFSQEANKALKRYNTAMYVSREQLLKQQIGLIMVDSFSKQEGVIKKHLNDSVDRTLKHQSGILGADVKVNKSDVKAIVNANFKGTTWSKRLWRDQQQLSNEVEKMSANVLLRGRHPHEYVKNLRSIAQPKLNEVQGKVTHSAKTLLITEAARVQTEAQKLHYIETLGEDAEYKFIAKLDERTSKVCRHNNGEVHKVNDMVPGVNAPPMHPNCRSTTAPYVGNWRDKFFKDKGNTFKLKDTDNAKSIEPVVEDEPKEAVVTKPDYTSAKTPQLSEHTKDFIGEAQSEAFAELIAQAKNEQGYDDFTKLWNHFADKQKMQSTNSKNKAFYSVNKEAVNMFPKNLIEREGIENDGQSGYEVLTHELAHFIDHQIQNTVDGKYQFLSFSEMELNGQRFSDVIRDEVKANTQAIQRQLKAEHKASGSERRKPNIYDARYTYAKRIRDSYKLKDYAALSDVMHGATYGKLDLGYAHPISYWRDKFRDRLANEAFAEMSEIFANKDAIKVMKKELPKSYKFYLEILKTAVEVLGL